MSRFANWLVPTIFLVISIFQFSSCKSNIDRFESPVAQGLSEAEESFLQSLRDGFTPFDIELSPPGPYEENGSITFTAIEPSEDINFNDAAIGLMGCSPVADLSDPSDPISVIFETEIFSITSDSHTMVFDEASRIVCVMAYSVNEGRYLGITEVIEIEESGGSPNQFGATDQEVFEAWADFVATQYGLNGFQHPGFDRIGLQSGQDRTTPVPGATAVFAYPNGGQDVPGCGSEANKCATAEYALNHADIQDGGGLFLGNGNHGELKIDHQQFDNWFVISADIDQNDVLIDRLRMRGSIRVAVKYLKVIGGNFETYGLKVGMNGDSNNDILANKNYEVAVMHNEVGKVPLGTPPSGATSYSSGITSKYGTGVLIAYNNVHHVNNGIVHSSEGALSLGNLVRYFQADIIKTPDDGPSWLHRNTGYGPIKVSGSHQDAIQVGHKFQFIPPDALPGHGCPRVYGHRYTNNFFSSEGGFNQDGSANDFNHLQLILIGGKYAADDNGNGVPDDGEVKDDICPVAAFNDGVIIGNVGISNTSHGIRNDSGAINSEYSYNTIIGFDDNNTGEPRAVIRVGENVENFVFKNNLATGIGVDLPGFDPAAHGNITVSSRSFADELFVDLDSFDVHLKANSPAQDFGVPTSIDDLISDMDGEQRVMGPSPDAGADEFTVGQ